MVEGGKVWPARPWSKDITPLTGLVLVVRSSLALSFGVC